MRHWKQWLLFLIVNIIVSAATTLIVLFLWNRSHPAQSINIQFPGQSPSGGQVSTTPLPQSALPPLDQEVISIVSVIAPGDLQYEFVILQRVGEGELDLTAWQLVDAQGNTFVFPEIKILQGDLEVYSRAGVNTVNKLYWNAAEAVWQEGEVVRILDYAGQERARYTIP